MPMTINGPFDSEEWIYNVNVQILKNTNTGEVSIGWAYPEFTKRIDLIKHADDATLARYIYLFSNQHYNSIEEIIDWLNESII